MDDNRFRIDEVDTSPVQGGPRQDHYDSLLRLVAEVSQDHAQLRTFIYEFARVKLRKELYPQFVDGAWSEIEEQVRSLEAAIERIEADFAHGAPSLQFALPPLLTNQTEEATIHSPAPAALDSQSATTPLGDAKIYGRSLSSVPLNGEAPLPVAHKSNDLLAKAYLGEHLRSTFWRNVQLILAAAIGIAIYVAGDALSVLERSELRAPELKNEAQNGHDASVGKGDPKPTSATALGLHETDFPIPTEYGIYAVVDRQLTELEQLPIKMPDPRIAISAPLSMPSRAHFSVGQLRFVVFHRDLATNAPDRIAVRVVAQILHELTFGPNGKPKMVDVKQSWVIRNNSYQMRVSPLADNPEMIVVRPDPPDFVFPAGRYALALKGVGYDFTVDGAVTDMAHCLERTDALGAPIYSECRSSGPQ
jgi:hypothetical protein